MLVADIVVGRLLLINLELRDDKVSFHGVSYPILPYYLWPYQSQSRVSLQLARRGAWLRRLCQRCCCNNSV